MEMVKILKRAVTEIWQRVCDWLVTPQKTFLATVMVTDNEPNGAMDTIIGGPLTV